MRDAPKLVNETTCRLAVVAAAESLVAPVYAVAMTTHQLSLTPDELRGRTTSAVSTLTTGALSIGTLAGGALISAAGAKLSAVEVEKGHATPFIGLR